MAYTIKTETGTYLVSVESIEMLYDVLYACTPFGESLICDVYLGDTFIEHVDIAPL